MPNLDKIHELMKQIGESHSIRETRKEVSNYLLSCIPDKLKNNNTLYVTWSGSVYQIGDDGFIYKNREVSIRKSDVSYVSFIRPVGAVNLCDTLDYITEQMNEHEEDLKISNSQYEEVMSSLKKDLYSPFSMGLHFSKYLALSVMAKDKNEFSESIRKSMGSNEIFDEKFSKFLDDVANNCFNQVNFLPIEFLTSGNRRLNKGSICSGDVLVGMDASGKLFYSTIIRQALSLRDLASIDLEPHNVYEKRSFFS